MSEIFETVNAHADAVQLEAQKRKEATRRQVQADRKLRNVFIGCVIVWVLMAVLRAFDQVGVELASFIDTWAGIFLAIWIGAWFQFRFCRKGLMK